MGLERECRQEARFANFLQWLRIIRRMAEFELTDFALCESRKPRLWLFGWGS
jgi:hypothetical protein